MTLNPESNPGLELLASLIKDNRQGGCAALGMLEGRAKSIMAYVRGKRPNTRLLGCWCFVNLASSGALDEEAASGRMSEAHVTSDTIVVVHAILKLFEEPHKAVKVQAPSILRAVTAVGGDAVERALCESGVPLAIADLSRLQDQQDSQVIIPRTSDFFSFFSLCDLMASPKPCSCRLAYGLGCAVSVA